MFRSYVASSELVNEYRYVRPLVADGRAWRRNSRPSRLDKWADTWSPHDFGASSSSESALADSSSERSCSNASRIQSRAVSMFVRAMPVLRGSDMTTMPPGNCDRTVLYGNREKEKRDEGSRNIVHAMFSIRGLDRQS